MADDSFKEFVLDPPSALAELRAAQTERGLSQTAAGTNLPWDDFLNCYPHTDTLRNEIFRAPLRALRVGTTRTRSRVKHTMLITESRAAPRPFLGFANEQRLDRIIFDITPGL